MGLSIEELATFCKRKGFVYPSGEIYGGLAGFWDFGPHGVEFKNNLKREWWRYHVYSMENIMGIDGAIITHPKVWEASGHVGNFVDVAVVCKKCGYKFKADKNEKDVVCEKCGSKDVEVKGEFNPMFQTAVGPIKDQSSLAYLRPETAQLIFSNFKAVVDNARLKLPFGIAQIGKSFRNEISPRNFLFRSREFEQMEIEFFINPDKKGEKGFVEQELLDVKVIVLSKEMQEKNGEGEFMSIGEALKKGLIKLEWHAFWLAKELKWFFDLGADASHFRIRQHLEDERSHYSTDTWDIEYNFPFGWKELEGIADRGVYDLSSHSKFSKKDFSIMDDSVGKKVLPMVVAEPSLGVERAFIVFLFEAYSLKEKGNVVLKLDPRLAPVKFAVLPLVKKDKDLVRLARSIYYDLRKYWNIVYDESGSVGRRYARNDEIGTPFCVTVDSQSLEDRTVTVRDRDSERQVRIKIDELKKVMEDLLNRDVEFGNLTKSL